MEIKESIIGLPMSMKFIINTIFMVCLFAFMMNFTGCASIEGGSYSKVSDDNFFIKATLLEYASLCDFPDDWDIPPNTLISLAKGPLIFHNLDCQALEKKYGRPKAVRVSFKNNGKSNLVLEMEGLSNTLLNTMNGESIPAVGLRWRGYNIIKKKMEYYFVEISGTAELTFQPSRKKVDLIFLFPSSAEHAESISVFGLKNIRLDPT